MTVEKFIKTKQKRTHHYAECWEKTYVAINLNYFISKNKKTTRSIPRDWWEINEDRDTLLRQQLLEYILEHFNLYELYVVFFNPTNSPFIPSYTGSNRSLAIITINDDESFTPEEAKRLKRKVWDMHPILFDMILEFINNSELFWDTEREVIVYPDLSCESS